MEELGVEVEDAVVGAVVGGVGRGGDDGMAEHRTQSSPTIPTHGAHKSTPTQTVQKSPPIAAAKPPPPSATAATTAAQHAMYGGVPVALIESLAAAPSDGRCALLATVAALHYVHGSMGMVGEGVQHGPGTRYVGW